MKHKQVHGQNWHLIQHVSNMCYWNKSKTRNLINNIKILFWK